MKGLDLKWMILMLLCICLFTNTAEAQQTSKTKASNKLYEKGGMVVIKNTKKINTSHLEFSPAFYQNGLVYATSRRSQGERDKKIDETYFELFYCDLDGNGLPLEPRQFSLEVNSHLHEGPVTFSRDGNVIYFTRNNLKKGVRKADDKGVTRLKIYAAEKGPRDWQTVTELPFNSDEYSVCHPTLSANGKQLYFASDMPGGQGGFDLWYVERQAESWSKPINLGAEVNSTKNEVFPFIHSSGNLFFSSNGHQGMGGLDLFMVGVGDNVSEISHMGKPFNSRSDDLGFILNPEGTKGYFTSDRKGGEGKDDIYLFEAFDGVSGSTKPAIISSMIKVYDAESSDMLEGAEVRIFERTSEGFIGSGNTLYEAVLLPSNEGTGELVFKLVRKDAGTLGAADKTTDGEGQAAYEFMGERKYLLLVTKDGYTSKEVVYSTVGNVGDAMIEVPMGKVNCTTFTGTVKDEVTGEALSGSVIKVLNLCDKSEEVILTDRQGRFNYCLPAGCDYVVTAIKERYENGTKTLTGVILDNALNADLMLRPIKGNNGIMEGSTIVLENIYYDFNKSYIRKGADVELDELRGLMLKYKSMEIELSAHTDSRGTAAYNQELSSKRAISAKEYLVGRGISASRITAVGYGESNLRNGCEDGVECSEGEHQYNRRTEVKVLKMDEDVNVHYFDHGPERIDRKD
ncbi:MAG: outer membrane protein OmpA-like peptidoglycan-associated protein [Polaribacter sp.]|jgi:outer membrane protein OmpA-like peptidoglycan-associated protein